MVKLQKTSQQQRRHSRQPDVDRQRQSLLTATTTSHKDKPVTKPCTSTNTTSSSALLPSTLGGDQVEQPATQHKPFEHSPSPLEASFVVVGREQFLKRASTVAQSKVNNSFLATSKPVAGKGDSQSSVHLLSIPSRNPRRTFVATNPDLLQLQHVAKEHPKKENLSTPNRQEALNVRSFPNTPLFLDTNVGPLIPQLHNKRSMSMPAIMSKRRDDSSPTKVSFSPVKAVRTYNPDEAASAPHDLPFTPKVDLESMLDDVSASYNERLAEAKLRSSILWKKPLLNHREAAHEAGVLKKRKDRREPLPTPAQPFLSTPYTSTKPGTQPKIVGSHHRKTSLQPLCTSADTANSIDLSNMDLIHPAFRPSRKSLSIADSGCDEAPKVFIPRFNPPESQSCHSCGHRKRLLSSLESPLTTPIHFRSNQFSVNKAQEPLHNSRDDSTIVSTKSVSLDNPDLYVDAGNTKKARVSRTKRVTNSSQESVHSSQTFVDVSNTEKASLFKTANKSEGDFSASINKEGWPMRMTNWKGPFAAQAQSSTAAAQPNHVPQYITTALSNTSIRSWDADHEESTSSVQHDDSSILRGRSLRRLTIGRERSTDGRTLEDIAYDHISQYGNAKDRVRESRSPSIYSTDSSGQSSLLDANAGHDFDTQTKLLDRATIEERVRDSSPAGYLPSRRRGTMTISPAIASNTLDGQYTPSTTEESTVSAMVATEKPAPTQYSLNISRFRRKTMQSPAKVATQNSRPTDEEIGAETQARADIKGGKTHVLDGHVKSQAAPQSWLQFRNNCRPIDEPPTPITPRLLAESELEFTASSHVNQHLLQRRSRIDGHEHKRKRLSKTRAESQNLNDQQSESMRDKQAGQVSGTPIQNSITQKQKPRGLSQPRRERIKQPEIPKRTKATTNPSAPASNNIEVEERPSRSRLPPNSFPVNKGTAQDVRSSRSRSRSRIRSMLEAIGLASKTEISSKDSQSISLEPTSLVESEHSSTARVVAIPKPDDLNEFKHFDSWTTQASCNGITLFDEKLSYYETIVPSKPAQI